MLNKLLSAIMFTNAALLLIASGRIEAALNNVQVNSDINRANKGIYTIGIMMLVAGVILIVSQKDVKVEPMLLTGLIGLLGLVLLALAAVVINKGEGEAKSWGKLVLVGGIVFLVGSGAVIANQHKDKLKKLVSHSFGDDEEEEGYFMSSWSDDDDTTTTTDDSSDTQEFEFACY
jgi:peptidoglycan/LPS O-acetylase OafA/YrhL